MEISAVEQTGRLKMHEGEAACTFIMDETRSYKRLEFLYHRSQLERFRSGELVSAWQQRYGDRVFDDDDLRIHKSQPQYHFYEFLAAMMFRDTMGYRTLIEKYETASHKEKITRFRDVAGEAVYENVLADRTGVPDLFVYSPDQSDWFFCEVKGAADKLRQHQAERFEQLYRVSQKPVYVLYLTEKQKGSQRTMPANTMQYEVVLEVAAAGGSITLYGTPTIDGWRFSRSVSDLTPCLINETQIVHDSEVANSWAGALALMDAYRWHRLNPIKVHPEFGQATFDAVDCRFKAENRVDVERLSDWSSVCGIQKLSK